MIDYSLETMEKLVALVEDESISLEKRELIRQMVLDEFDRCISCNPAITESDCPYRCVQSYGKDGFFWSTKCRFLGKEYFRDSYDYEQEDHMSDCPYLKLKNRIK